MQLSDFKVDDRIVVRCKDYQHAGRFVGVRDSFLVVRVMGVEVYMPTSDIVRLGTYLPPTNGRTREQW